MLQYIAGSGIAGENIAHKMPLKFLCNFPETLLTDNPVHIHIHLLLYYYFFFFVCFVITVSVSFHRLLYFVSMRTRVPIEFLLSCDEATDACVCNTNVLGR